MSSVDLAHPGIFSRQRITLLVASIIVALSSGTNYVFSAYSPQLGERLRISHTQLNIVGLAGNLGVYFSGPFWGRAIDLRGPRYPFLAAFILLLSGYAGIRILYGAGLPPSVDTIPTLTLVLLVVFAFFTGSGANAGLTGSVNSTAKSFPDRARATTTGLVLSGFGLSAFLFSTIAHTAYPGDTGQFLVVLALGTSLPMILGFLFVRPIPLPPSELNRTNAGPQYEELEAEAAAVGVDPTLILPGDQRHGDEVRTRLLAKDASDEDAEAESEAVALGPSASGMNRSIRQRSISAQGRRSVTKHSIRSKETSNLYGLSLFRTLDFWLLFSTLALLTGTGLMYINNVGSMSQVLYATYKAQTNKPYIPSEALKWQSTQVSTISVTNFAGRIFLGLVSDYTKNKLHWPRSYSMTLVSLLMLASQLVLRGIDDVSNLWAASAVLGLAYGSVFALFPTLTIEWFGMLHFAENWGYVSLAPAVGGNLFSIAFGRNLDAHESTSSSTVAELPGAPSRQCIEGKKCYVGTLNLTIAGCLLALGLSAFAAWRDHRKEAQQRARRGDAETVWDAGDV